MEYRRKGEPSKCMDRKNIFCPHKNSANTPANFSSANVANVSLQLVVVSVCRLTQGVFTD